MDTLEVVIKAFVGAVILIGGILLFAKVLTQVGRDARHFGDGRKVKAFKNKKCFHCGYDLRANTHRCPECGHHIPIRPIF